jgi:hypothetical protein
MAQLRNLEFHQERFERSRRDVLGTEETIPGWQKCHPELPEGLEKGLLKCRVTYAHGGRAH